jgi:hypothetical protein
VNVLDALGAPATNAQVRLSRFGFPSGDSAELTTDILGTALFGGLWEGDWRIQVERLEGANKSRSSAGTQITRGVTNALTVTLGPIGTLAGRFVEDGTGRPIAGAQVIARLTQADGSVFGTSPTANDGSSKSQAFLLNTYFLLARNPVSGRLATAAVRLTQAEEVRQVVLVEQSLGDIHGMVLTGEGTQGIPGATVSYSGPDIFSPKRTVTTDPSGAFRFANVPVGSFQLSPPNLHSNSPAALPVNSPPPTHPCGSNCPSPDSAPPKSP